MPGIKRQLYYWSIIYYLIVFVAPYVASQHECHKTFSSWLYGVFCAYLVSCALWEIITVVKI